jgi:hypothetical protein
VLRGSGLIKTALALAQAGTESISFERKVPMSDRRMKAMFKSRIGKHDVIRIAALLFFFAFGAGAMSAETSPVLAAGEVSVTLTVNNMT